MQLLDAAFPKRVALHKLNCPYVALSSLSLILFSTLFSCFHSPSPAVKARFEDEFLLNLRLLQDAFKKLSVPRMIPSQCPMTPSSTLPVHDSNRLSTADDSCELVKLQSRSLPRLDSRSTASCSSGSTAI